MSDRNDDDFNFDDDLFGDAGAGADADADLNFDEDPLDALGTGDDFGFDDEPEGGRTNRTFVVLAFIIILLFIVGVVAIILFALNRGPSTVDITRTAIAEINLTQQSFLEATQTQNAENVRATGTAAVLEVTTTAAANIQATGTAQALILQQTQVAVDATQTALALPTATATPGVEPTVDTGEPTSEATLDLPPAAALTAQFETLEAQTTSAAATALAETLADQLTEQALTPPTATGQVPPGGISPADVLLTATALSLTLQPVTPDATIVGVGTPFPPVATRLPETGLFDDITGTGNFGVFVLMAIGLIGVIFASRRLRKP